jgi:hypothetical protein
LRKFIEDTVEDSDSLLTPGTPQNLALEALAASNPELDPEDPSDQVQIIQRYALNTLFFSTGGEQWKNNQLWTDSSPLCGEDVESSWHGVVCDVNSPQVIQRLSLAGNDLVGPLPTEIALLTSLCKYVGCLLKKMLPIKHFVAHIVIFRGAELV